jgi:hypothetical protein
VTFKCSSTYPRTAVVPAQTAKRDAPDEQSKALADVVVVPTTPVSSRLKDGRSCETFPGDGLPLAFGSLGVSYTEKFGEGASPRTNGPTDGLLMFEMQCSTLIISSEDQSRAPSAACNQPRRAGLDERLLRQSWEQDCKTAACKQGRQHSRLAGRASRCTQVVDRCNALRVRGLAVPVCTPRRYFSRYAWRLWGLRRDEVDLRDAATLSPSTLTSRLYYGPLYGRSARLRRKPISPYG